MFSESEITTPVGLPDSVREAAYMAGWNEYVRVLGDDISLDADEVYDALWHGRPYETSPEARLREQARALLQEHQVVEPHDLELRWTCSGCDFTASAAFSDPAARHTEHLLVLALSQRFEPEDAPLFGRSMRDQWKPGELVEYVWRNGAYEPEQTRPAVVVGIDEDLMRHEHLVVRFEDNGEQRTINPDVMRHRREPRDG